MTDPLNGITAGATLLLAAGTGWLGWHTRQAVRESVRSRVDARAPRVAALLAEPEWPPFGPQACTGAI